MNRRFFAALAFSGLFLAGCVSQATYEAEFVRRSEIEALNEDLAARMAVEKQRSEAWKGELAAVKERLERLSAAKDKAEADLAEKTALLERYRSASEGLGADMDVAKKALRASEQEKADLRAQAETKAREHQEALRSLEAELNRKLRELEGELSTRDARIEALRGRISDLEAERSVLSDVRDREEQEKREKLDETARAFDGLLESLKEEAQTGRVTLTRLRDELSVSVREEVLFAPGGVELKDDGKKLLDRVGSALSKVYDKLLAVEGHADNAPLPPPLAAKYPTLWDFTAARAVGVARYLIEKAGVDPTRLTASGTGGERPAEAEDTPEARAGLRRIEIRLLPLPPLSPQEPPAPATPATPATPDSSR